MAGCDKADRNRKSAANVAYKAGNREAVNKEKAAKHTVKHNRSIATKNLATGSTRTPKGMARALRRMKENISQDTPIILQ